MDFEQLKYIRELRENPSMTQIAEKYYTSHQTVRNAIKRLEYELNTTVCYSTKTGTFLTQAGLCIAEYAEEFNTVFEKMLQSLEEYQFDKREKVIMRIYLTPGIAKEPLLEQLMSNEDCLTEVSVYSVEQIIKEFAANRKNTLAIFPVFENNTSNESVYKIAKQYNLQVDTLFIDCGYAVMHKNADYANKEIIMQKDLQKFQGPIYTPLNANLFCEVTDSYIPMQYYNDLKILKSFLKAQKGMALITKMDYEQHFSSQNKEYTLIPLSSESQMRYVALYQSTQSNEKIISDLLKQIKKILS